MAINWKQVAEQLEQDATATDATISDSEWLFVTESQAWSGVQSAQRVGLEAKLIPGKGLYVRHHVVTQEERLQKSAAYSTERQRLIDEEAKRIDVRYEAARKFLRAIDDRVSDYDIRLQAVEYALKGAGK